MPEAPRPSYWLTRFLILRLLGLVYFVAFLSLAQQVLPLMGADGLLPARLFLERVQTHLGSRLGGFLQIPSLFWLDVSDRVLIIGAWAGTALSLVVLLCFANALLLAVLWGLYMSFVHIGQDWYGYGWEIQLLETGFLAIFLCPLLDPRPFPGRPVPRPVVWLLRWLVFRIMLGAGLIKLRGDPCWRDFTCLYYHYETQQPQDEEAGEPVRLWRFHASPTGFSGGRAKGSIGARERPAAGGVAKPRATEVRSPDGPG